ncbi:alpha/beta fold hydrolase [Rhizobium sp. BK313]|uniref:alpha/beta fold hydrolase n=1 Tax=Rhizobium sp. BK313 TaxID=2587081 RepID=UPI001FEE7667|nr:alpha/beta hydrolase [Rhizobium sp. BK313]
MAKYGTSLANCTSGRCQANGIDIHFLRTGGDKPPLVALHGLIGSGACLSPVARTLKGDFDVILPDARGHGQSSGPVSGYSYPELAADVIGLIEKLALDQPILLGHSMGGADRCRRRQPAWIGHFRARPGRPHIHQSRVAARGFRK